MHDWHSLSHVRWDCKYHVVILRPDHIHMCLSVAQKFSIAFVIGFLKGKNAVRIHRYFQQNKQTKGKHFWSRGYCVSTVGLDEETIRNYIRELEEAEKQQATRSAGARVVTFRHAQ